MRRLRFFLGIGLALGLSGCAGNHQCFLKKPCILSKPCLASEQTAVSTKKPCFLKTLCILPKAQPCLATEQVAVAPKKPCFLKKLFRCKKCGQVTEQAPPPPVLPMPQASAWMTGTCGHVVSTEVPAVSEAAPQPLSSLPSPTPPDRVAGYFPTFNPRGGPGVVAANWPDPLGVRSPGVEASEAVWRTSGEEPAPGLQESSARMFPTEAAAEAAPAPAEGEPNAVTGPAALPEPAEGATDSLPTPPNPSPVPPIEPSRPKSASLQLELENVKAMDGRPSLTNAREPSPRPRRVERPEALGDLVFPVSYYPAASYATTADPAGRLVPVPRDSAATEAPKRVSILGRIVRRIRGAASPCDPEADSARGEARDVAQ
jgi:hypothetical protein